MNLTEGEACKWLRARTSELEPQARLAYCRVCQVSSEFPSDGPQHSGQVGVRKEPLSKKREVAVDLSARSCFKRFVGLVENPLVSIYTLGDSVCCLEGLASIWVGSSPFEAIQTLAEGPRKIGLTLWGL